MAPLPPDQYRRLSIAGEVFAIVFLLCLAALAVACTVRLVGMILG
jgi:hypothetical protein